MCPSWGPTRESMQARAFSRPSKAQFDLPRPERDHVCILALLEIYGLFAHVGILADSNTFFSFIRVLSGVLHVDEEHAHLSKDEILQSHWDVLKVFYTKAQQDEDLKRAQAARCHWATWREVG
jgi:hypothetical protein